jgi:hypothetical protein
VPHVRRHDLEVTLQQDLTHVLQALFDIRTDVKTIVSLLREEDGGEQGDEEEDS